MDITVDMPAKAQAALTEYEKAAKADEKDAKLLLDDHLLAAEVRGEQLSLFGLDGSERTYTFSAKIQGKKDGNTTNDAGRED